MKKYILLVLAISVTGLTAKSSCFDKTKMWDKTYGVHQLKKEDKSALASGLYYLLTSKGQEQIVDSFVSKFYSERFAPDCRGAFLKVYEYSALASDKKKTSKTEEWTKTLLPYYTTVLGMLDEKDLIVAFGEDAGKKLPSSLFELDRILNPRPEPVMSIVTVTMPGFSFQIKQTMMIG